MHARVNSGQIVVRVIITSSLAKIANDDDEKIMILLKYIKIFSMGGPSRILTTEIFKPNDSKRLSQKIDEARAKEVYNC